MTQTEGFGGVSWQVDLGTGRRTEVEVSPSGGIWLATGELTNLVEIWMKKVAGIVDLRVHLQRTAEELIVVVDRGDNGGSWWRGETAPRLIIRIGPDDIAEIRASIGIPGQPAADHLLGRIPLDS